MKHLFFVLIAFVLIIIVVNHNAPSVDDDILPRVYVGKVSSGGTSSARTSSSKMLTVHAAEGKFKVMCMNCFEYLKRGTEVRFKCNDREGVEYCVYLDVLEKP